jgi:hypothetical protein
MERRTGTYPRTERRAWTLGALTQSPSGSRRGRDALRHHRPDDRQTPGGRVLRPDEDHRFARRRSTRTPRGCFCNCPPPAQTCCHPTPTTSRSRTAPHVRSSTRRTIAGDVANENFCQPFAQPRQPSTSPCLGLARDSWGRPVLLPNGSCVSQNSQKGCPLRLRRRSVANWIRHLRAGLATRAAPPTHERWRVEPEYIGTQSTPRAWTGRSAVAYRSPARRSGSSATGKGGGVAARRASDFNPNYSPVPPAGSG